MSLTDNPRFPVLWPSPALSLTELSGAASYEVQTARSAPTLEDNWRDATVAPNTRNIVLSGLPLAQKFRVRGVRRGRVMAWAGRITVAGRLRRHLTGR